MIINGIEYGFYWSVGAHLAYDAWIITHQDAPMTEAIVQQAVIMSKAYNEANNVKGASLKRDDLLRLPSRVLDELGAVIAAQVKADSEVTVETKPGKRKAAEN